jgi:CheY-like chemotaxis protein
MGFGRVAAKVSTRSEISRNRFTCCSGLRRLSSSEIIFSRSRKASANSLSAFVIGSKENYVWDERKLVPPPAPLLSSLEGKLETVGHLAQASAVPDRDLKRILVVDDDTSLTRLISEALRSRFRCEVDATPNPEYGFELALKKRYRVFVFDFSMPMIDGAMLFTLIDKVYNHVNPPLVVPPLILISGRGDEARAQELMKEAGVRGFLPKPFAMNRLMEKISEVAPDLEPVGGESMVPPVGW